MRRYGGSPAGYYLQAWPVRNVSGEEIPPYACMRIDGYHQQEDNIGFQVGKPDTFGSQWGHIFNGPRPIPAETGGYQIGEVFLGPLSLALYDDSAGEPGAYEHWGPRDDSWKLHRNTGGFLNHGVISADAGKLCIVQQYPMLTLLGKTAGIGADSTGTLSIYWQNPPPGTLTDTGVDITVHNAFAAIDADAWVACQWHPWGWECVAP